MQHMADYAVKIKAYVLKKYFQHFARRKKGTLRAKPTFCNLRFKKQQNTPHVI